MLGLVSIILLLNMLYFTLFIALTTLCISTIIYYELLYYAWYFIDKKLQVKPTRQVLYVVFATMISHMVAILLYAIMYYLLICLSEQDGVLFDTTIDGLVYGAWNFIYFSATTYSSLGYGDMIPTGELRILAMFEVINGLVLIAWSASSAFLAMEKSWQFKKDKKGL